MKIKVTCLHQFVEKKFQEKALEETKILLIKSNLRVQKVQQHECTTLRNAVGIVKAIIMSCKQQKVITKKNKYTG